MVTGATYRKQDFLDNAAKLDLFQDTLFGLASRYGWLLQAWAALSNHYHFIALAPPDSNSLSKFINHMHAATARELNRMDDTPGRKVWFQYWDSPITFEKSYLTRLNYAHRNAVHHGLVTDPVTYQWCSAAWFERTADRSFFRTVWEFPCDRLSVTDDF
jgi:putative transposase